MTTGMTAIERAEELMNGVPMTRQEMRECIRDLLQEIERLEVMNDLPRVNADEFESTRLLKERITDLEQLLYGARCVWCDEIVGSDMLNQDLGDELLRQHVLNCAKHPAKIANDKVEALQAELAKYSTPTTGIHTTFCQLCERDWAHGACGDCTVTRKQLDHVMRVEQELAECIAAAIQKEPT